MVASRCSVRSARQAAPLVHKSCVFLCGAISNETMSPVHPEKFIEWEYDPVRCATCHWCALTFKNKWAHLMTRNAKKAEMAKNKDKLDEFQNQRSELVSRRKKGRRGFDYTPDSSGKPRKLEKGKEYKEELLPAPKECLTYDEYMEMNPNITKKEIARRGHEIRKVGGSQHRSQQGYTQTKTGGRERPWPI